MTFEQCVKEFPIWKTYIGTYSNNKSFTVENENDIDAIETWDDPILEWNQDDTIYEGCYPFVVYDGNGHFTCWYFAARTVNGYLNETDSPDEFYPATYSEDFGWEPFNPNDYYNYNNAWMIPDYELCKSLVDEGRLERRVFGNKWMNEQVAYVFDKDKYMKGEIFTSYEQLKKFVHEGKFREG